MPNFDNTQAFREGWCLSDCFFDDGYRYQIQRLDNPSAAYEGGPSEPVFEDDFKALEFVKTQADAGSEYHIIAIKYDGKDVIEADKNID